MPAVSVASPGPDTRQNITRYEDGNSVKRSNRMTFAGAALIASGAMAVGVAPAMGASIGSGATFPQLVYKDWCASQGCSYTGKGSSGGIRDFIAGTVDFAGSDAIMTPEQVADLAAKRGGVTPIYLPTLLGAISVPTNTTAGRLKLDGKVLGEIFSGGITKWNDSRITKLNAGKRLPNADITVCVRADGSGTSYGFSNYLTKVSTAYRTKVGGASQTPAWAAPRIIKGTGNPASRSASRTTPTPSATSTSVTPRTPASRARWPRSASSSGAPSPPASAAAAAWSR